MADSNSSGRSHRKGGHRKRGHRRSGNCVNCGSRSQFSQKVTELNQGDCMENNSLGVRSDRKRRHKKKQERGTIYGEDGSHGNNVNRFEERQQISPNVSGDIFGEQNKQQNGVICIDSSDDEHNLDNEEQHSIDKNNSVSHVKEANDKNEQQNGIINIESSDEELNLDNDEQYSIDNINHVPQVNEANERNAINEIRERIDIDILDGNDVIATIFRLRSHWIYGDIITLSQLNVPTSRNELFKNFINLEYTTNNVCLILR